MRRQKTRPLALLLSLGLVLGLAGCGSMLERSYASVTPHTQFSDESDSGSVLRAETYQGLVSALLHLVEQGAEKGELRLYQYSNVTGAAASDVDQACLEVTQEDPLGAYAVDYIKYDVEQTVSYYQINVKLAYNIDPKELKDVISVTGSTAVRQELEELLPDQPKKVVFRIGYFSAEDSAATLRQAVQDAYDNQSSPLPALENINVTLYPDHGQQRVAAITLIWQAQDRQTVENILGNLKK